MIIKLPRHIEIHLSVTTKRSRVFDDLAAYGKLLTIKRYIDRYKCGLKEAHAYVNKIESEEINHGH